MIRERIEETPHPRVVQWHWSEDWFSPAPWSLDEEVLPYFCRKIKDYGDGKILTAHTIGPIMRVCAEIVDEG